MATIYDVAREASVSTATVSRALRGRPEVLPEVRERVEQAATRLGYRPNRLARALTRGKTNMIGMVLPEPGGNPFYSDLMEAVSRAGSARGYATIIQLATLETESSITDAANYLEDSQVDGLILFASPIHLDHYLARRGPASPPVITIGPPEDFAGPMVRADEQAAGGLITRHLLELGHECIAFVGPTGRLRPGSRQLGYVQAMRDAGLEEWMVASSSTAQDARRAVAQLLGQLPPVAHPSALVCFSDHTALGVLHALQELAIPVPRRMSVVGFDNAEIAQLTSPPLTTVDLQTAEVARIAVDQIIRQAEEATSGGESSVRRAVPPTIVVRSSTAPPGAGRRTH